MHQALATLAYGLSVCAIDLYFASDARHRLTSDRTLEFIDLICLRRERGDLQASSSTKINRVPIEIWHQVRELLVLEAVADSQDRKLRENLCNRHAAQAVSSRLTIAKLFKIGCGQCEAGLFEWCLTVDDRWEVVAKLRIDQLLFAFGLACPTQPLITEYGWREDYYLALVGAPSRFLEPVPDHSTVVKAMYGGNQGPNEHSLVDVSFDLPPNIDRRLMRFIRLFNLEVYDGSVNELVSTGVNASTGSNIDGPSREGKASGVRGEVAKEIKPRWKLWTACEEI